MIKFPNFCGKQLKLLRKLDTGQVNRRRVFACILLFLCLSSFFYVRSLMNDKDVRQLSSKHVFGVREENRSTRKKPMNDKDGRQLSFQHVSGVREENRSTRKKPICFPEVPTVTSWGAPIVWEGAYDIKKENRFHQEKRTVVGLSVFAVKQYLEDYLADFLFSANLHFMPNLSCVFYILTDRPDQVPDIKLRPGVSKVILEIPKRSRWQDVSMLRMKDLLELVLPRAVKQVNYLFCMDVDQIFTSSYGPEVLGELVAQLHAGFYLGKREDFTYEKDPQSAAYIPPGEGQFYYHAAVFGGTPSHLFNLTTSCLKGILKDKKKNVEAVWHDESHLNRYFTLEAPPLKILSPEYCWDNRLWLRYHKLVWAEKKYWKTRL